LADVETNRSATRAVERRVRAANRVGRTRERRHDGIELPALERAAERSLRLAEERHLPQCAYLKDVRAIEAREREVLVVHHRMVVVETDPSVLVRHVLCAAQRV